jgi:arylsulfatase B
MRLPRRWFPGATFTSALCGACLYPLAIAAQTPPNIVLILVDDAGVELFGAYNMNPDPAKREVIGASPPEHAVTPTITDLAEEGLLFRNVWSSPVCSPTRAALFTGRFGFRTGVITGGYLEADFANLPRFLSNQVHETANLPTPYLTRHAIGKWHLTNYAPYTNLTRSPTAGMVGFTGYAGYPHESAPYTSYPWAIDPAPPDPPASPPIFTEYLTTKEIDEAIAFVNQEPAEPWFLWLALHASHAPYDDAETPTLSATCAAIEGTDPRQVKRRVRCRQLEVMNAELARLMTAIRAHDPALSETTVIFLGDNGSWDQFVDRIPGQVNSSGKGTVYEGGINVPLIVAGAGVYENNPDTIQERAVLLHAVDVFATVLDLAGVANPNYWGDGVSFAHVLDVSSGTNRTCVYADGNKNSGGPVGTAPSAHDVAIRDSRYKLIREPKSGGGFEYRFFDLLTDPSETTELPEDEGSIPFTTLRDALLTLDEDPTATSPCKPGGQPPPECGLGFEAIPALLLIGALRRRRANRAHGAR